MVFNYCFTAIYPDVDQKNMRNCVQSFKKYNRIVQAAFGEVVRRRREASVANTGNKNVGNNSPSKIKENANNGVKKNQNQ